MLLGDMPQFVLQQQSARYQSRRISVGAKYDVAADGEAAACNDAAAAWPSE
jgi:hypothetical protein